MNAQKIASPFVRALLLSPAHRLLSGSLVLLTYTGTKSRRTFTIPVMYAPDDGGLLLYAGHPETKNWWRNLRAPAEVRIRLRGVDLTATGSVVAPTEELRRCYLERFSRAAGALDADPSPVFVRIDELRSS